MDCPACGETMRDGWLVLLGEQLFTKVRWSPKRIRWGPRPLPRGTHVVIGSGFGPQSREALRCEECGTVVVPPPW